MAQRFIIGRDRASDIAIADDSVSRTHAEIWLEPNGILMLADRGSSNGTELIRDGQASLITQTALMQSDQVRFGAVTLGVRDLIDAVEARHPGALISPAVSRPPMPPPLPPVGRATPPPPPPIAVQQAAPPPSPPPMRAAVAQQSGLNTPGPLVRCECGAIKSLGQLCPGCHR